ncbi:hypothetical protein D5F01_LYC17184 [Larimichthys crocea]|uniref:Uncharacterized protein n=1 Tax=Larimichthys crocea TaxID=215358 RepID=A0A6G0HX66_LARCR|nr:hypothetical protein D5F01_LYC17184 [Larimichthys crocea]
MCQPVLRVMNCPVRAARFPVNTQMKSLRQFLLPDCGNRIQLLERERKRRAPSALTPQQPSSLAPGQNSFYTHGLLRRGARTSHRHVPLLAPHPAALTLTALAGALVQDPSTRRPRCATSSGSMRRDRRTHNQELDPHQLHHKLIWKMSVPTLENIDHTKTVRSIDNVIKGSSLIHPPTIRKMLQECESKDNKAEQFLATGHRTCE